MSREREVRVVTVAETLNVFDVWERIIEKHPEITRFTVKPYIYQPHGFPDISTPIVVPRERIEWGLDADSFYGQPFETKSIGARVEVRPDDYDPQIDYSGAGRWFNEGDFLTINPERSRSFLFVDMESIPGIEMRELCIKTLRDWPYDWYLLDTGFGYHLIIDRLISYKILPLWYGRLIMDMAWYLPRSKSIFFGHIGKYLMDNWQDVEKIRKWARDIRQTFGHIEEKSQLNGKYCFPMDLRYLAYIFLGFDPDNPTAKIDEGYLRVSPKYGSIPVVSAMQIDQRVTTVQYTRDPFERRQLLLPIQQIQ